MENISTRDILEKVDELVELIKRDPSYVRYLELKKSVTSNCEVMSLIENVKTLQKDLVKLEYRKEDTKDIQKKLDDTLEQLKEYPIYNEFVNTQEDVDEVLQQVKFILESIINSKIK